MELTASFPLSGEDARPFRNQSQHVEDTNVNIICSNWHGRLAVDWAGRTKSAPPLLPQCAHSYWIGYIQFETKRWKSPYTHSYLYSRTLFMGSSGRLLQSSSTLHTPPHSCIPVKMKGTGSILGRCQINLGPKYAYEYEYEYEYDIIWWLELRLGQVWWGQWWLPVANGDLQWANAELSYLQWLSDT